MALGFGFNKAKVLNTAEKYVQQGKLQNAVNEYEKIIKQEPKDLTVLNTIGDLYARLGQTDRATAYFKRVGDIYGGEGFTVKAIAMYKKITKLSPGAQDCIQKLAELYTQQGLYNDARQQYVSLADQYVKANDLVGAARIFQKILELDPENTAMQSKLAELYIRTGKQADAQAIYFRAAESLYQRGATEPADEALQHVLRLDPGNARAMMMRGKIALESGDAAAASQHFAKVPDLDSHPEVLHALLRAHLQQNQKEKAESLARKLLEQNGDFSGVSAYAEWLFTSRSGEEALRLYLEFADQLMANNRTAMLESLNAIVARVKENPAALEMLLEVFRKAEDEAHVSECSELLAHALVKAGDLHRAEELYRKLAELEPENPIHEQHHRQVLARLGEDAAVRPLSQEEGAQAFMVDELEVGAPEIPQAYPEEQEQAIKAALTDSELFDSYNAPAKALAPLEKALAMAPQDVRLNQRLASLYARLNRFAEAAACCEILRQLFDEAGHTEQAIQYRDMAARYRERGGTVAPPMAAPAAPAAVPVSSKPLPEPVETTLEEQPEPAPAPAAESGTASEIDLSEEWETTATNQEAAPPAEAPAPQSAAAEERPAEIEELLNEIRFYLSQDMWEEAQAAVSRLAVIAPDTPELPHLRSRLAEIRGAQAPEPAKPVVEAAPAPVQEFAVKASSPPPEPAEPPRLAVPPARTYPVAQPAASAPATASADVLGDFVLDLEDALGSDFQLDAQPAAATATAPAAPPPAAPPVSVKPAAPAEPVSPPPAAVAPSSTDADSALSDMFAEFKEEAEQDEEQDEDPETHYNLGVAFKEMGLLDEAIGELQKVCHAIDRGRSFSQVMQAYTWLAHCFVEKGVPEAGVKWYEKALAVSADNESRMAVHYDLASAYEAAGNKKAALQHFLEVYGTNIDYRDVADRIHALRS